MAAEAQVSQFKNKHEQTEKLLKDEQQKWLAKETDLKNKIVELEKALSKEKTNLVTSQKELTAKISSAEKNNADELAKAKAAAADANTKLAQQQKLHTELTVSSKKTQEDLLAKLAASQKSLAEEQNKVKKMLEEHEPMVTSLRTNLQKMETASKEAAEQVKRVTEELQCKLAEQEKLLSVFSEVGVDLAIYLEIKRRLSVQHSMTGEQLCSTDLAYIRKTLSQSLLRKQADLLSDVNRGLITGLELSLKKSAEKVEKMNTLEQKIRTTYCDSGEEFSKSELDQLTAPLIARRTEAQAQIDRLHVFHVHLESSDKQLTSKLEAISVEDSAQREEKEAEKKDESSDVEFSI